MRGGRGGGALNQGGERFIYIFGLGDCRLYGKGAYSSLGAYLRKYGMFPAGWKY